jgi:hypothetical protein
MSPVPNPAWARGSPGDSDRGLEADDHVGARLRFRVKSASASKTKRASALKSISIITAAKNQKSTLCRISITAAASASRLRHHGCVAMVNFVV